MTAPQPKKVEVDGLSRAALQAFDNLNRGQHAGYRPVHAKGALLTGSFTPAPQAKELSRAPHLQAPFLHVAARFSDFAGIPSVADTDLENASPRGLAIRFYLSQHAHTDIIAHSVDGFPARTAEEFIELLRAAYASGPGVPKPTPVEQFLATHPAALAFIQAPKPIPSSFLKESYFAVSAYQFTNASGTSRFGRYRIVPENGTEYLSEAALAAKGTNFLFAELQDRLSRGPARMRIEVQLAGEGDVVDDSTSHWPADRPVVPFGTIELQAMAPESEVAQRHIIFDPIPRVDGIAPSGDPLLDPRANLYLASGRRRRSGGE